MMSARYAVGVIGLAVVALVPTVVHNYLGLRVEDGPQLSTLRIDVPGMTTREVARPRGWFINNFQSDDVFERDYVSASGSVVRLSIIRSYDAKSLYHHPENAVAYGQGFHTHDVVQLDETPGTPVHRLQPEGPEAARRVALYALRYRGEFVRSPLAFQFGQAWRLLLSGRAPMTLVFVQTRPPQTAGAREDAERRVLTAAVKEIAGT
jgi:Protein of unknown function (DUF3485)